MVKGGSDTEISQLDQGQTSGTCRSSQGQLRGQLRGPENVTAASNSTEKPTEAATIRTRIDEVSHNGSNSKVLVQNIHEEHQDGKARLGVISRSPSPLPSCPHVDSSQSSVTLVSGPDCSTPLSEEGPQHSPQPHTPTSRGGAVSSPLKVDTSGGRTVANRRSSESDLSTPPKSKCGQIRSVSTEVHDPNTE